MTQAKHTPGPWKFAQPCCHAIVVGDRIIASAEPVSQEDFNQSAIDFALIAAAPDLLAVLLRAKDAIEALDGTSIENEKLVDDYRAVIAKAGGAA